MSEEPQTSESVTVQDAGCQFPTGPGGQVCGRAVVRSGAPSRPSSYCDRDGHTRAKAFAARRRFELAAAREPGEQPGTDAEDTATERPVTDGRASFGVLLARFEDTVGQTQRAAAEQATQLEQTALAELANVQARADQAATQRRAAEDHCTELDTARAAHHAQITTLRRDATDQLTAVLARLERPTRIDQEGK